MARRNRARSRANHVKPQAAADPTDHLHEHDTTASPGADVWASSPEALALRGAADALVSWLVPAPDWTPTEAADAYVDDLAPMPDLLGSGFLDDVRGDLAGLLQPGLRVPAAGERPDTPSPPTPGQAAMGYDDVSAAFVGTVDLAHTRDEWFHAVKTRAAQGERLTLRGGGCTFDTKAAGQHLLLGPHEETDVTVRDGLVTAGGAATWRDTLRAMLAQGRYPRSVNTSSRSTVGGTLAADCLSRFSPKNGREGNHVRAFTLLCPDGETRICTPDAPGLEGELFHAAISGFGMFGAFASVTFESSELPAPADTLAVKTEFGKPFDANETPAALDAVLRALVPAPGDTSWAHFANLWYTKKGFQGALGTSSLVKLPLRGYHPSLPFAPYAGSLRFVFETIAALHDRGFSMLQQLYFRLAREVFYDPLEDYTFFMDGNDLAKQRWREVEKPLRLLQQTFMIPAGPHGTLEVTAAASFIREAREHARELGLWPAMHDVLYIPQDTRGFLLSATRSMNAFAVTLAFEHLGDAAPMEKVRSLFTSLSRRCHAYEGRVHLVKNVIADDAVLREMYADVIPTLRDLRARVDPRGALTNEIGARLGLP
jgi:FAD/FMN-containing dehydrogenase